MSEFQSLDAVVTGCAYDYATTALGILERGNAKTGAISGEMLCTLDNFIKTVLFNDRVFVTGTAAVEDGRLVPRHVLDGGRNKRRPFEESGVCLSLPKFDGDTDAVTSDVWRTLTPVEVTAQPHFYLQCTLPRKKVTVRQEMLSLDPYFIEYAIAQCGAQRFKPVFPGEHLYLGLRSKRLARPEATHTVADVAGIRLRALIGAEMDQLNKLVGFGAPFLPPLPPIFVTQMLDNAGQRRDLAAQILSLRDSRAIRGFRDWARKCMELARSPDPVKRKEAADAVVKLEGLSFEAKSSTSTIINSVKLAMQLAKGDFAGIFLGYAESAIQYFSKRPLSGLEKFSGQNVDSGKLDAFLEKNFGDKFNRNDLNSVSIFLGLAENIDRSIYG